MFKVNNKDTRKTSVLESVFNNVASLRACNLIKKALQRRCLSVAFIVNFEHISKFFLVFLLLTLNN